MGYDVEFNLSAEDYGLEKNTRTEAQAKHMNAVLAVWMAHPNYSNAQICEAAGISEKTFCRYKENEVFMSQYDNACRAWFRSLQNKALDSLYRKLDKDDWNAVKYLLDGSGFSGTQKVEVDGSADIRINIINDD